MGVGPARVGGCALVLELDTLGWVGACGEHSEPKVREGGAGRQRTGLAPVFTQNKRFSCALPFQVQDMFAGPKKRSLHLVH